jgi:hypothetical protein
MKLIEKIKADPRIESLHDEGDNGWWAILADGYILQPDETTAIHETTLSGVKLALSRVKPI